MAKENREKVREILRALQRIRFGSVEVTVHSSKIVQIEIREKVRFEKEGSTK